jgi:hypothetical protein
MQVDDNVILIFEIGYYVAQKFGLLWVLQAIVVVRLVMAFTSYIREKE